MVPDAGYLLGREQPARALDERVGGVLGRVVGGVDDDVDALERFREPLARGDVDPVLRAPAAEHPHLVSTRAQRFGDGAAQRSCSSGDGDSHVLVTTQRGRV